MKRLILFDIDGTLLTTDGAAKRAFHRALLGVFGTAGPITTHQFDGKTDPQIARELLSIAGLTDSVIDGGFVAFWPAYLRELANELARPGHRTRRFPGVPELIDALAARSDDVILGLLTGNIEAGASLKLRSAGLDAARFRLGAYGSDRERRDELPAIAIERARSLTDTELAGHDVVVIGDTPRDMTCGRALGVRAVGVATGRFSTAALAAAHAHVTLPDLSDTPQVVESLMNGSR